jgi:hypothetical protein
LLAEHHLPFATGIAFRKHIFKGEVMAEATVKTKLTLGTVVSDIEGKAKDVLEWLTKETVKIAQGGPRAIAALGVLLGAVEQFFSDGSTGNLTAALNDIKPVWADLKAFAADLGIKL